MRDIVVDKQGEDTVLLDVRGLSSVTDFYLIAGALNTPHIKALTNELTVQMKKAGMPCARQAGDMDSGWVVIDFVDVIVHLFLPEVRSFYMLEELWSDAPVVSPDATADTDF